MQHVQRLALVVVFVLAGLCHATPSALSGTAVAQPRAAPKSAAPLFNDCHFHLTNYIQEGIDIASIPDDHGRHRSAASALFGIPLQQTWSYADLGRLRADLLPREPTRRSTTTRSRTRTSRWRTARSSKDAAGAVRSDDHGLQSRRTCTRPITCGACCRRSPACSPASASSRSTRSSSRSKVAGETAEPRRTRARSHPRLRRRGRAWSLIVHNDIDMPFSEAGRETRHTSSSSTSCSRGIRRRTIIWAHTGLGRVVRPVKDHAALDRGDPRRSEFEHVYFDISWNEVAKYLVATPETLRVVGGAHQRAIRIAFCSAPTRSRRKNQRLPARLPAVRAAVGEAPRPRARRCAWATTSGCSIKRAQGSRVGAREPLSSSRRAARQVRSMTANTYVSVVNRIFEIANVTGYEIAGTVLCVVSCAARRPALLQRAPATAPSKSASFMLHPAPAENHARNGGIRPTKKQPARIGTSAPTRRP